MYKIKPVFPINKCHIIAVTFQDGDKFWRMPECYIRGSTIKYLRIPDEVIDMVKEDAQVKSRSRNDNMKGGGQNQRGGNRNTFNQRGGRNQGGGGRGGGGGQQNKKHNKQQQQQQ